MCLLVPRLSLGKLSDKKNLVAGCHPRNEKPKSSLFVGIFIVAFICQPTFPCIILEPMGFPKFRLPYFCLIIPGIWYRFQFFKEIKTVKILTNFSISPKWQTSFWKYHDKGCFVVDEMILRKKQKY